MKNTKIREWIEAFIFAIIFTIIMFVLCWPVTIEGTSMEPNFRNNDKVFISRALKYLDEIKRGEIYVLRIELDGEKKYIIKRIIGIPGDVLEVDKGLVYLNNDKLDESYILGDYTDGNLKIELKSNEFFILGDNREDSRDSRSFGVVNKNEITGKVYFRIYPFNKITTNFN